MIDISNLTSLITAFRQETEQGDITPGTVGLLLQQITNVLHDAGLLIQTDTQLKYKTEKGIFEGDLEDGELEIGQAAALINKTETAQEAVDDIISEFNATIENISKAKF